MRWRPALGRGSVIFGMNAFAEGVDLAGDLCRHVIITRLPFPPFDSAIGRNLKEWFGAQHFSRFSLPAASMRLVQACGRLLRNEMDHGRITILDRRLLARSYGRKLIESLPDYDLQAENSALQLAVPRAASSGGSGTIVF